MVQADYIRDNVTIRRFSFGKNSVSKLVEKERENLELRRDFHIHFFFGKNFVAGIIGRFFILLLIESHYSLKQIIPCY